MKQTNGPSLWALLISGSLLCFQHSNTYSAEFLDACLNFPNFPEEFYSADAHGCYADVVGRKLNSPAIGDIGHVGLIYRMGVNGASKGTSVIEVLNNSEVININSLTTFKNEAPYWGAVYNVRSGKILSADDAVEIISHAVNQKYFEPKYSYTINWQEGKYTAKNLYNGGLNKMEKRATYQRAIFRCDTFVNYAYSAGTGIKLPINNHSITPAATYNSFKNKRAGRIRSRSSQSFGNKPRDLSVEELFEKVQLTQGNAEKFMFYVDALMDYKPHQLTDELIEFYQHTQLDLREKDALLTLLEMLSHSNTNIACAKKIQEFLVKRINMNISDEEKLMVAKVIRTTFLPEIAFRMLSPHYKPEEHQELYFPLICVSKTLQRHFSDTININSNLISRHINMADISNMEPEFLLAIQKILDSSHEVKNITNNKSMMKILNQASAIKAMKKINNHLIAQSKE